jgi:hypothetical protein
MGNPQTVAFTGGANGTLAIDRAVGGVLYPTGQLFAPVPGYRGALRVAGGDFNGDGVTDYAVVTGPGVQATVAVLNGRDGSYLVPPTVLFPGYTGGLYVAAADIDGTGRANLIISAGDGAPPIVQTFRITGGTLQLEAGFIAFDAPWWRGGIRIAAGDINHDGYADVVVTTASGLGAVAIYSGAALRTGTATQLVPAFIPFPALPVGLNAAVGDMNGDGFADLAITFNTGGPAIVAVWSGATLTANPNTPASALPVIGAFLALPPDTGGARLAIRDLSGDGRGELVVASGNPHGPFARVFTLGQVASGGIGGPSSLPLGGATLDGLYVG